MATGKEQATFGISLEGNAETEAAALSGAFDELADRMGAGEDKIRDLNNALKRLKGATGDVSKLKADLNAKLQAEKAALERANVALLKQGVSYEKLTAAAKKAAAEKKKAADAAIAKAEKAQADAVKENAEQMKKLDASLLGVAGAIIVVEGAVAAGAYAFARWIFQSASMLRTQNLLRQAAVGTADNARNLGTQIDELARKVPTARAELNQLSIDLAKGGIQGQTLVDTLNAVGQASAALGNDAGAKLRELVDRGRLSQRFAVNPFELQGSGLEFGDIAEQVASRMKVSIAEAKAALAEGRVLLGDGAAALRAAVEKKFGRINLAQMLDLDVIEKKLGEGLASLTSDVDLEPLADSLKSITDLADSSTVQGAALKQVFTDFGNTVVTIAKEGAPLLKGFITGALTGLTKLEDLVVKIQIQWLKTFGKSTMGKLDLLRTGAEAGKYAVYGLAVATGVLAATTALALLPLVALAAAVGALVYIWVRAADGYGKAANKLASYFTKEKWEDRARNVIDGLAGGLLAGVSAVKNAGVELGKAAHLGFDTEMQIKSPSRRMMHSADMSIDGLVIQTKRRAPEVDRAFGELAPIAPPARGLSASAPAAQRLELHVHLHVGDAETARTITRPSTLNDITRALERALQGAGIPVTQ